MAAASVQLASLDISIRFGSCELGGFVRRWKSLSVEAIWDGDEHENPQIK
jgi:hypothetical protein